MKKKRTKLKQPSGEQQVNIKSIPQLLNNRLSLIWIDMLALSQRSDGNSMLRFFSQTPEGNMEQARLITSISHVKQIIDLLAKSTGYYPTKSPESSDK